MTQINDTMHQALSLTYAGALPDMVEAFKQDNAPWQGWDAFLAGAGFTVGALPDRKLAYFKSLLAP